MLKPVDTWEDRMAAKASERRLERERQRQEQERRENAVYRRQAAEEQRAAFEAGPPGSCYSCYDWAGPGLFDGRHDWRHFTIDEGDCTCYHECHGGEPAWCGLVAYA